MCEYSWICGQSPPYYTMQDYKNNEMITHLMIGPEPYAQNDPASVLQRLSHHMSKHKFKHSPKEIRLKAQAVWPKISQWSSTKHLS